MGLERTARVTFISPSGEAAGEGRALLETAEVLFRGPFRLRIPFADIHDLRVEEGMLTVTWPDGCACFEIGQDAARWADRIRNPRGLVEKLGLEAGMRVALVGLEEPGFQALLERSGVWVSDAADSGLDAVFLAADGVSDLARLPALRHRIKDAGAVWVVSRKGRAATLKDTQVMAAARAAGLIDTKVVSFSETRTALKLVIPRSLRSAVRDGRARTA
ncbi:MAG TPA: DUF3052 family protein [Dehalococcoidia bacterium]|nr:DUF3052 family protein [Dehalococcoidia bacterium]